MNLIFSVLESENKSPYVKIRIKSNSKKLYLSELLELAKVDEKELVKKLAREEQRIAKAHGIFESDDTKTFNEIRIEKKRSLELLKILSEKYKINFNFEKKEEVPKEEVSCDPLPILQLCDKFGCFANLLNEDNGWHEDLLESGYIFKPQGSSNYYCPLDKVAMTLTFLLECGWKVIDSEKRAVLLQTDKEIQFSQEGKKVIAKGNIHFGDFQKSIKDVAFAYNKKEAFIELSANSVGLLDSSFAKEKGLFEGEFIGDAIKVPPSTCFSILQETESNQLDYSLLEVQKRLKEVVLPASFKGELRPYQLKGLSWLTFLNEFGFGGILADEMGLGKTVQVIAFIATLPPQKPILIVLPASLVFNWKNEMAKFLPKSGHEITLISYSQLRMNPELFTCINYSCVILDEAQVIKNPNTQIAKAVYRLQADCRISLSGTPIENSLMDLWSQYHFLMPKMLGELPPIDPRSLMSLKKKIAPFLLRRTKEEVAKDLPQKIEQVVFVEMSEEQRTLYDCFLNSFKANHLRKHRMEVFEAILRLRQICCNPLLIGEETSNGGKWEALIEDIRSVVLEKKKVLVFSQFTSCLKLIAKELQKTKVAYLDGKTKDRESQVRQFQEDEETQVFLISLKAGGVGLNLTKADYVFLFDPWWNDAVENQATSRAHRIGRVGDVIVKRYITVNSIEEKMMKLKEAKRELVCEVIDDSFEGLSEEDIDYLIS